MNRKVLQKLIDELDKESPRLDYIRGVLETLMENIPNGLAESVDKAIDRINSSSSSPTPLVEDEGLILEKEAMARLKNIKDIAI